MRIIDAHGDPPSPAALSAASEELAGGRLVGIPTDTVYGLAVDPFRPGSVQRLFRAKARPDGVAMAVLVADQVQAEELVGPLSDPAAGLAARWWPGALTLVVTRPTALDIELGGDRTTIGLRCPAHPVPVALCRAVGPLATTSANRHGQRPAATARAVALALEEDVSLVLDAGSSPGAASTVVDCTRSTIACLREGAIAWPEVLTSST